MSRHEGVSCDSCLVGNFRGKRYKCLVCYDYDLCATCYEAGATNTRHTAAHPMQCILTRSDFDLYYGGEAVSVEQPQSFTCPLCGKMGFTEGTLQEHVSSTHIEPSPYELVCPICAALPGGDPNLVTDDFAAHLMLEHRSPRDLDEPSSSRQVRRIPHPGRGVGATRTRRANMHFSSSGGLTSLSPGSRDSMDPIADFFISELLSQLSGVRRSGGASPSQTTSQLQQLQMQLQLERQQVLNVGRQHLDRVPRRQAQVVGSSSGGGVGQTLSSTPGTVTFQSGNNGDNNTNKSSAESSQFLLPRYVSPRLSDKELEENELEQNYHSAFVCELLMNALVDGLPMDIVNLSPMKTLPWHVADEGELTSASQSQKEEIIGTQVDGATLSQPQIQEIPQSSSVSLSPPTSNSKQTGNNMTTATSKKNPVHPTGSTNRVVPTSSRSAATTASAGQQTSTRETPQQQLSSTLGNNGLTRGSSSNVSQQQPHQPPQQRLAPQGTGTVREIPVPQAVVTGRMPPVRGGTSPSSSTRRKMVRHMDGRNQPNDPPPPH
ncbi:hypothetical protein CHUAL_010048 [Chamberlinius hualienensis]